MSDNDVFTPSARKEVLDNSGLEPEMADSCILEGEVTIKRVSVIRSHSVITYSRYNRELEQNERAAIGVVRETFVRV